VLVPPGPWVGVGPAQFRARRSYIVVKPAKSSRGFRTKGSATHLGEVAGLVQASLC